MRRPSRLWLQRGTLWACLAGVLALNGVACEGTIEGSAWQGHAGADAVANDGARRSGTDTGSSVVDYKSPTQGDLPSEKNGRNVSIVPLTLMEALGTGITSWGTGAGQATKVIAELLV